MSLSFLLFNISVITYRKSFHCSTTRSIHSFTPNFMIFLLLYFPFGLLTECSVTPLGWKACSYIDVTSSPNLPIFLAISPPSAEEGETWGVDSLDGSSELSLAVELASASLELLPGTINKSPDSLLVSSVLQAILHFAFNFKSNYKEKDKKG